jgi:hypothetical protein
MAPSTRIDIASVWEEYRIAWFGRSSADNIESSQNRSQSLVELHDNIKG